MKFLLFIMGTLIILFIMYGCVRNFDLVGQNRSAEAHFINSCGNEWRFMYDPYYGALHPYIIFNPIGMIHVSKVLLKGEEVDEHILIPFYGKVLMKKEEGEWKRWIIIEPPRLRFAPPRSAYYAPAWIYEYEGNLYLIEDVEIPGPKIIFLQYRIDPVRRRVVPIRLVYGFNKDLTIFRRLIDREGNVILLAFSSIDNGKGGIYIARFSTDPWEEYYFCQLSESAVSEADSVQTVLDEQVISIKWRDGEGFIQEKVLESKAPEKWGCIE